MKKTIHFFSSLALHKKLVVIIGCSVAAIALLIVLCSLYIGSFKKYIINDQSTNQTAKVGIVFGSGVDRNGKPYKELQARLDSAADALQNGVVEKLILSGDNRFLNYNEPEAMASYLINERGIDEKLLQPDYAGRSTYETCERAIKIFNVDKAILFSAYSHLPRAIFTCRSFGIESFGIGNTAEATNAGRREPLARVKAMFNVYLVGEKTILGDQIPIE